MKIQTFAVSAIWNYSIRKLTGFGAAMSVTSLGTTALAAAGTVDLRPTANISRNITGGMFTPNNAGAAAAIQMWDGSAGFTAVNVGQNSSGVFTMNGTQQSVGMRLNNNGTQSDSYTYCYEDLFI